MFTAATTPPPWICLATASCPRTQLPAQKWPLRLPPLNSRNLSLPSSDAISPSARFKCRRNRIYAHKIYRVLGQRTHTLTYSPASNQLPDDSIWRVARPPKLFCPYENCRSGAQFSQLVQHALAQDVIRSGLISLAGFLQPIHDIGVQPQGHRLFYGPIKPATNGVFPGRRRKLRYI